MISRIKRNYRVIQIVRQVASQTINHLIEMEAEFLELVNTRFAIKRQVGLPNQIFLEDTLKSDFTGWIVGLSSCFPAHNGVKTYSN